MKQLDAVQMSYNEGQDVHYARIEQVVAELENMLEIVPEMRTWEILLQGRPTTTAVFKRGRRKIPTSTLAR